MMSPIQVAALVLGVAVAVVCGSVAVLLLVVNYVGPWLRKTARHGLRRWL